MFRARDFRHEAWDKLSGKWGTAALIAFILSLIVSGSNSLSALGLGAVVPLLITGPFNLGVAMIALNIVREKDIKLEQLFEGFKNFERAFLVYLLNGIFVALWSLLFIIPGIIKSYAYSMSYFILADNPEITATEARKRSIEMMRGNKWRLFCLNLSFIGWMILGIFTLGILYFWIIPYMEASMAAFYKSLLPETETEIPDYLVGIQK